ncbi:TetR/AcrR family transcriptional regulator [Butyricicoccus sp. 1XD8-22]|nr:TetR/AcrR family transcriptional regulator [Butyricicoccus sp. 1XD8-22]
MKTAGMANGRRYRRLPSALPHAANPDQTRRTKAPWQTKGFAGAVKGDHIMEKALTARKTDRRTLYTKMVVKDALLELLAGTPFDQITVTAVCKQAEITRTTFYLHFADLTAVLDEVLEDAMRTTEQQQDAPSESMTELLSRLSKASPGQKPGGCNTLLPICQRMADQPKYHALFLDETLSDYIIKKAYLAEREKMIPVLEARCGLSRKEADKLFLFIIYGAFSVNKSMCWGKDDECYHLQGVLDKFISGGFSALAGENANPPP